MIAINIWLVIKHWDNFSGKGEGIVDWFMDYKTAKVLLDSLKAKKSNKFRYEITNWELTDDSFRILSLYKETGMISSNL